MYETLSRRRFRKQNKLADQKSADQDHFIVQHDESKK